MASKYHEIYQGWQKDPEGFWANAAKEIDWYKPAEKIFDDKTSRWFAGTSCNTCSNSVDRHVERGRAGQPAIIYDSPITGSQRIYTYEELLDEVEALASVCKKKA